MESLRKEIEGPPDLDEVILGVQTLTSRIHAAYLFKTEGIPVLQKICLLISSTPPGKMYSGWQEFGAHLGLTREQLQCIKYDFRGLEDPTFYVLKTFVHSIDPTVDKILTALKKMERLDVINRLIDPLTAFVNNLDGESDSSGKKYNYLIKICFTS